MTASGPSEPSAPLPWAAGGSPPGGSATRPSEVRTSVRLWVAAVVLHLVSLLAVYVAAASLTGRASRSRVVGLGAPHVTYVIVTAAIGLALAIVMGRGRNWARITLTVLGALSALGTAAALIFFLVVPVPRGATVTLGGPVGVAVDILQVVCVVAAIVMFYRPRANAYFAAARR